MNSQKKFTNSSIRSVSLLGFVRPNTMIAWSTAAQIDSIRQLITALGRRFAREHCFETWLEAGTGTRSRNYGRYFPRFSDGQLCPGCLLNVIKFMDPRWSNLTFSATNYLFEQRAKLTDFEAQPRFVRGCGRAR